MLTLSTMAKSFKYRLQSYLRETIEHRRYLIRNKMSRPNELIVSQKLTNLEYWSERLKNDHHAATFLKHRFDYIKGILPHYPNQLEPHTMQQLRELHNEALLQLQPKQLSIFQNQ